MEAHLRMAICLEHRHRDPQRALFHAEQLGDERRSERLTKKIAKRASKKMKKS